MSFYTAEYIKKLAREDAENIVKTIKKGNQDFRTYLDSTLPFTLYLTIDSIKKSVVTDDSTFIQEAISIPGVSSTSLKQEIINAYIKVINYYIDTFPKISSEELNEKLLKVSSAVLEDSGNIKSTIQGMFKNTMVVEAGNLSVKGSSVLIISPKFTTIQKAFGSKFKEFFDYSKFSDNMDLDTGNAPRKELYKYIDKNFGKLQNLGHAEVDVISSTSSEVKRGIVTPALFAALIDIPSSIKPEKIARQFSKQTGQAETRIIVRKKFTGSKLVLEMLIEAGMMIGTVEATKSNAAKAPRERSFTLGSSISKRILEDPSFLSNLETSKSIVQYIEELLVNDISGKSTPVYTNTSRIDNKTPFEFIKASIQLKGTPQNLKQVKLPKLRTNKGQFTSLASLQSLLNSALRIQIQKNMGSGNRKDILNYRTGRFASSAKVERMSQSREGMITAFYTYMKSPYQTFSSGGMQAFPKTRDPKLLISKSIREIAANLVGNRLRAVNL